MMSHSDSRLLSVEDMSEIPSTNRAPGTGGSKGVNLFLARQKLIADMMEHDETSQANSAKPSEGENTKGSVQDKDKFGLISHAVTTTTHDGSVTVKESELPASADQSSKSKSKGVNLFLARQKLIADMMEAEAAAERAVEEEKKRLEEERLRQEELERQRKIMEQKKEEERRKIEEQKRLEQEKLLESIRAAEARAAKFKPKNPVTPATEPEPPAWVKKTNQKKPDEGKPRQTLYQILAADKK